VVVFDQVSLCALIVVHSLFSPFWSNTFCDNTFGSYEKINCFFAAENTKIILNCLDLLSILSVLLICDVVLCCQF